MAVIPLAPRTPITRRADRGDLRIRFLEEAVLLIRGEWPAAACGICETINRSYGLILARPRDLEDAISRTTVEASHLVEALYGSEALAEVERLSTCVAQEPEQPRPGPRRAEDRREHLDRVEERLPLLDHALG